MALAAVVVAAPTAPALADRASIVVDAESGRILHQHRPDHRHYPASLTKLMTLYLLFEALDEGRVALDTRLPVSARAAGQTPSKLGLRKGQTIRVHDAILALIVKSANDVATVVAEALGGEEWRFAQQMMTPEARALGMRHTVFRNASGLPNRHQVSTARDMAVLARALYRDFPHHYHYFAVRSFRFGGKTYATHNDLLDGYGGADGLKTGYTRGSLFNLVASAERDGRRIVGVVLGEGSSKARDRKMARLLDRGFARLGPVLVAAATPAAPGAAPAPPPVKPRLVAGVPWAIQVGAYSQIDRAYAALEESRKYIPGIVATASAVIVPFEQGDGGLYRARFVGVSFGEANRACRILNRQRLDCAVVQHGGDLEAVALAD